LNDVSVDQLRTAIESRHSCRAEFVQSVQVREKFRGKVVWDGTVSIFAIEDHPEATTAYAWSSSIEKSEMRSIVAVLRLGLIRSPVDAVRAAIVAEHRAMKAEAKVNEMGPKG